SGTTGHYEAIRVIYDPAQVDYQALARYFFEIHDPTQADGQGPDHGEQYQSAIFYYDEAQKQTALHLMTELKQRGYAVVTHLLPVSPFWRAETYHQDYYEKNRKQPYCHHYVKRFS
ncbi:MAG: peptide-methionine (S)-S-oxide reductase, partial [Gammaproteobacteria bacterium]